MAGPALTVLQGDTPNKKALFEALAHALGGAEVLDELGTSDDGFDQTAEVGLTCLQRAKNHPKAANIRQMRAARIGRMYNWTRRHFTAHPDRIAVVWNGVAGTRRAFMEGARHAGAGRLYAELAPFPGFATLDPNGMNFEGSVPRSRAALGAQALSEARREALCANLKARKGTATGVDQISGRSLPQKPFLFVPLQVPDDSQVRVFGGWAGGMVGFVRALERCASKLPDGWHLRVKEHPSSRDSLAKLLANVERRTEGRIQVDNATDTYDQIRASRAIITMNSSLALQSFLLRKSVVVTGQAFFGQDGLVSVAQSEDQLAHFLSAPDDLEYDDTHRMEMMGYLFDRYWLPCQHTNARAIIDTDRAREKAEQARALAKA